MENDLISKIESLPESLRKEVEDFIDFLKAKKSEETVFGKTREAGFAKGMFVIKEGFDDPLEDFKDYQ